MMHGVETLDCTEVATALACATCLLTAVGDIVTSGPEARTHKKNARCETPLAPPKKTNSSMATAPQVSMLTIKPRKYVSMILADNNTEMTEPIPKMSSATLMPPKKSRLWTSKVM